MHELLKIFRAASGLEAHHVSVSYPDLNIEFNGYQNGKPFHIISGPTTGNLEYHARALGVFQKHRIMAALEHAINYGGKVSEPSKATAFTERLKKFRTDHAADLDKRAAKYDELTAKRAALAQRMDSMEASDTAELEAIDAELRQLSNSL